MFPTVRYNTADITDIRPLPAPFSFSNSPTFSALMTPMFLGSSSTKKSVAAVRKTALHRSAYLPRMWSARCVKSVVA